MSNDVTVQVTITERVRYSTFVTMPLEKFEELEAELEDAGGRELRRVEERIGEYCDRQSDWQDADDLEIEEFRVVDDYGRGLLHNALGQEPCAAVCARSPAPLG